MTSKEKPLLAYAVQEEDEGTGGIVFARSNVEARRRGSSEFGDGDFNWGKATRARWADAYAPGPVPISVMIENGWWFCCQHTGIRIDSEHKGKWFADPARHGVVYGSVWTWLDHLSAEGAKRAELQLAERMCRLQFPNIKDVGAFHVGARRQNRIETVPAVHFRFPGGYSLVTWHLDNGELQVWKGDTTAWNAWRDAGCPAEMREVAHG